MRLKFAIALLTLAAMAGGRIERQASVAEAQQAGPALTGDVIVKFKDGTSLAGVGAALDAADASAVATASGLVLLDPADGQSVQAAVDALSGDPNVAYAEPDVLVSIDATPNDTYYANQAWHYDQINAPAAWEIETGDPSTVVAVIDTGVQMVHPDLNDNVIAGANFVTVPIANSTNASGKVRINTSTAHPYLNGEQVTISGHSAGGANGTWTISMPAAVSITSSSVSGGTITVTTATPHSLNPGDYVMVRDHTVGAANGEWTVTSVPNATQFRYSCSPGCTSGSGTGGVAKVASWFDLSGSTFTSGGSGGTAKNVSPRDDEGHGTFVAGLIAAESNNSAGAAGVCWTCKIMPVKVLGASGTGSTLAVAAGINWAVDNGADVLNLSLSSPSPSQTLQDAVDYAWTNGVIVVAASGNDNGSVKYPAHYPNVIAVGATNSSGVRSSFSNFGPELDVVAPGESVLSTLGTGFGDSGGWYGYGSGTSFASPHVAGVVGLMISHGMTDKNAIVTALTSTAVDAGAAGRDDLYGWGIVDAAAAVTGGADTTPPTTSITAPANGATVSGVVNFTASASDAGGMQKVRFWVDSKYLGFDATAPYEKAWDTSISPNGSRTLQIEAIDKANNSTFASITVTNTGGDAVGPNASIAAPRNNATVSGTTTITAYASDASGIEKVRFWVDSTYFGFDAASPWEKTWDTTAFANGSHTVKIEAIDRAGNSTIKTVTAWATNGDSTGPALAITSPAEGADVSGNVNITATASDESGLEKVRFWAGTTYLGFDPAAPYQVGWDTTGYADRAYVLKAEAIDHAGNSTVVTINVTKGTPDVMPPTATLDAPLDGATVSGTVLISASASDDRAMQKVRFWVDSTYLGFDADAPYEKSWDTTSWPNGVHTLKVQPIDAADNLGAPVTITVTVSN